MNITTHFKGVFVEGSLQIQQRLSRIKAYVFDWDGVFNNGMKDEHGSSPFSEIDAMGTNLLRFNHYLVHGTVPLVAIISGEKNKAAYALAGREHFNSVYSGIKYKADALKHLCEAYGLEQEEVGFVFDDVIDLSIAATCGLRIMIGRRCNPLLVDYAVQQKMADYLTACEGGNGAVREAVELLTGLSNRYMDTIEQRMNFTDGYRAYLEVRDRPVTAYYHLQQSKITEDKTV